jgi:5-methylcytosine-specific restriction protein A
MFVPGQVYKRRELHKQVGGQERGGISTPKKHPMVLIFTGHSGSQYGYADRWLNGFFYYTGEGQEGDMEFRSGNSAIRDHAQNRKELHLFEQERKSEVRYFGRMVYEGFEWQQLPDRNGELRKAIVFHLRPADAEETIIETAQLVIPTATRQGFRISPEIRKATENHAIEMAKDHFRSQGYQITVLGKPYDLRYCRGKEIVFVEVKGTSTAGDQILLTPNEVDFARQNQNRMTMFVLHGIQVSGTAQQPAVSGGTVRMIQNWNPEEDALEAVGYWYALPAIQNGSRN